MVPPQCGWGRTAFGSTHEPRSTHNPLSGPPRTAGTCGPRRSSRTPAPSQRLGPRPGRRDIYSANQGRVSVNKFPEGFPGCRVFGLLGQGSGLPSLALADFYGHYSSWGLQNNGHSTGAAFCSAISLLRVGCFVCSSILFCCFPAGLLCVGCFVCSSMLRCCS